MGKMKVEREAKVAFTNTFRNLEINCFRNFDEIPRFCIRFLVALDAVIVELI